MTIPKWLFGLVAITLTLLPAGAVVDAQIPGDAARPMMTANDERSRQTGRRHSQTNGDVIEAGGNRSDEEGVLTSG